AAQAAVLAARSVVPSDDLFDSDCWRSPRMEFPERTTVIFNGRQYFPVAQVGIRRKASSARDSIFTHAYADSARARDGPLSLLREVSRGGDTAVLHSFSHAVRNHGSLHSPPFSAAFS